MSAAAVITPQDYFDIRDLLMKYAFSFDTGNVPAVVAVFTPDGSVRLSNGERVTGAAAIHDYYTKFVSARTYTAGMHYLQQMRVEQRGGDYVAHSYWWVMDSDVKGVRSKGYSYDTCVKHEGAWRIKERAIYAWAKELPWKGPEPAAA